MKILALDFDGVISDSAPECFWVALRTLSRVCPSDRYRDLLASLDGLEDSQTRDAVSREPLYRSFLELMPLGNRAEDFGVALLALEAGVRLENQPAYDRYFESLDSSFASNFHRQFYREREIFRTDQPERWGQLASPYGELVEVLRRRVGAAQFVIATAKDRVSVEHLIARYEIADLFGPESVLDKELGRDKRNHLSALRQRSGVDFSEITFIDDKVNHLIGVRALGVRCFLAGWGYNGMREQSLARENGIGVCDLTQLEAAVFD